MYLGDLELSARGGEELRRTAEHLKIIGDKDLNREFYSALNRALKPMRAAAIANAESMLPTGSKTRGTRRTRKVKTGRTLTNAVSGRTHEIKDIRKIGGEKGLRKGPPPNELVAKSRFSVKRKTGGSPQLTLKASGRPYPRGVVDVAAVNRGVLRHPLFGNRKHWSNTRVTPGWFTRAAADHTDTVRRELLKALDEIKKQITG
jgi:hypothetical protein